MTAHKGKVLIIRQLCRVYKQLDKTRRRQLFILLCMMVVSSLAELFSIGMVIPFLGVLTESERFLANDNIKTIITFAKIKDKNDVLLAVTIIFCLAVLIASLVHISLMRYKTKVSLSIGAELSSSVFEKTLRQSYRTYIRGNSSNIVAGLSKANAMVNTVIQPALNMVGATLIITFVLVGLVYIQPIITLISMILLAIVYLGLSLVSKVKVNQNSEIIAKNQNKVAKVVQEGLGGIRDVILNETQALHVQLYRDRVSPMQEANAKNQIISQYPRYIVEALGIIIIAIVAFVQTEPRLSVSQEHSIIPLLGALALGAQRLLPLCQQIYASHVAISGSYQSTNDALEYLEQSVSCTDSLRYEDVFFKSSLAFLNVSFRYEWNQDWVIKGLDLEIRKGSVVGIIGRTGTGKSTILDLIMGLIEPESGEIKIDDVGLTGKNVKSWRKKISHVPQTIFLSDCSIAENIALGIPKSEIDHARLLEAVQTAQLAEVINKFPDKFETLVGERGINLSGGQIQRIGIARALYKKSCVIVLDEATSALDSITESKIIDGILEFPKRATVIMVSHRLSALVKCDLLVELKERNVNVISDPREISTRLHRI
jgi:ABC-type multidrug transport system fused ATPase/permease subunit